MSGYRGYITSRPLFGGDRAPQHVQNIVLRSYAQRKGIAYLLAAVEYTMPDCYQMLTSVLDELPKLDGILAYSMFMLPEDEGLRRSVYDKVLSQKRQMHFAVEEMALRDTDDVERMEDIWLIQKMMAGK